MESRLTAVNTTEAGGLMSYGPNWLSMWRRAADLVDSGAKPAEIPIEQRIEFDRVINLRTANAPGLAIPDILLALANAGVE
jgi:putative tryptophan/tyrosine transport system substrate-binding protein